jgi:hypothetical protein
VQVAPEPIGDTFDAVSIQWVRFSHKLKSLKERLLDAGYVVVPVNPDLVARRRGPAKKKDDAEDARIACLLALDRFERLRPLIPHGQLAGELRWCVEDGALLEGRLSAMGAHVVLARGPATSPTPSERSALANGEDVEAIVSIHANGLTDANGTTSASAHGAAAYYFGTEGYVSERGRMLAQLCVDHIVDVTGTPNCRTHASTSAILRESRAPAVIVEPGFLTHPQEGEQLTDAGYQLLVAAALADALQTFLAGVHEHAA